MTLMYHRIDTKVSAVENHFNCKIYIYNDYRRRYVFSRFDKNLLTYLKFFDTNTCFFAVFLAQKGAILGSVRGFAIG
jgi:hypothetical protein